MSGPSGRHANRQAQLNITLGSPPLDACSVAVIGEQRSTASKRKQAQASERASKLDSSNCLTSITADSTSPRSDHRDQTSTPHHFTCAKRYTCRWATTNHQTTRPPPHTALPAPPRRSRQPKSDCREPTTAAPPPHQGMIDTDRPTGNPSAVNADDHPQGATGDQQPDLARRVLAIRPGSKS